MSHAIGLAEVFNLDGDIGHGLDHVCKRSFRFPELANAQPEDAQDHRPTHQKAGQEERGLSAEDGPAKAVDDADNRVQVVEQAPLWRDHTGTEADRRNVTSELPRSEEQRVGKKCGSTCRSGWSRYH